MLKKSAGYKDMTILHVDFLISIFLQGLKARGGHRVVSFRIILGFISFCVSVKTPVDIYVSNILTLTANPTCFKQCRVRIDSV